MQFHRISNDMLIQDKPNSKGFYELKSNLKFSNTEVRSFFEIHPLKVLFWKMIYGIFFNILAKLIFFIPQENKKTYIPNICWNFRLNNTSYCTSLQVSKNICLAALFDDCRKVFKKQKMYVQPSAQKSALWFLNQPHSKAKVI